MILINALYLLALITWIGSIIFFSFVGAPSIFQSLPPEYAGKVVATIFPRYYPLGYISGFVAVACVIISGFNTGQVPGMKFIILTTMLTISIYTSLVTYPRAHALKEEMRTALSDTEIVQLKQEFSIAHRASVVNNGAVLLLGIILVVITAENLRL